MKPFPRIDTCFFKMYILTLSSYLRLCLSKGLFPVGLHVKIFESTLTLLHSGYISFHNITFETFKLPINVFFNFQAQNSSQKCFHCFVTMVTQMAIGQNMIWCVFSGEMIKFTGDRVIPNVAIVVFQLHKPFGMKLMMAIFLPGSEGPS